jgi:metallophosphoesterase superfamily enzyme
MAAIPLPRTEIQPDLWLDARLALWLARSRTLVVADLHWGYATTHRARGNLLPLWGDAEIASRLDSLIADYQPGELLWLGDSLHALAGRAPAETWLRTATVPVTVLAGNHDVRWPVATTASLHRDRFFFHHGDRALAVPAGSLEIVGHHHPAFSWSDGAGGRLKIPALIASPRRFILPAFSPWAAGSPWNNLLGPEDILWAVTPKRIFAVDASRRIPASRLA